MSKIARIIERGILSFSKSFCNFNDQSLLFFQFPPSLKFLSFIMVLCHSNYLFSLLYLIRGKYTLHTPSNNKCFIPCITNYQNWTLHAPTSFQPFGVLCSASGSVVGSLTNGIWLLKLIKRRFFHNHSFNRVKGMLHLHHFWGSSSLKILLINFSFDFLAYKCN